MEVAGQRCIRTWGCPFISFFSGIKSDSVHLLPLCAVKTLGNPVQRVEAIHSSTASATSPSDYLILSR